MVKTSCSYFRYAVLPLHEFRIDAECGGSPYLSRRRILCFSLSYSIESVYVGFPCDPVYFSHDIVLLLTSVEDVGLAMPVPTFMMLPRRS